MREILLQRYIADDWNIPRRNNELRTFLNSIDATIEDFLEPSEETLAADFFPKEKQLYFDLFKEYPTHFSALLALLTWKYSLLTSCFFEIEFKIDFANIEIKQDLDQESSTPKIPMKFFFENMYFKYNCKSNLLISTEEASLKSPLKYVNSKDELSITFSLQKMRLDPFTCPKQYCDI